MLVHGAAGGVGTASLQVAKGLGARTIAVVSSDEKERGRARGRRRRGACAPTAPGRTRPRSSRAAASTSCSTRSAATASPTACARCARAAGVVVVGFTGGSIPEVKVNRLLLNNIEVVGAGWGAYVMGKPDVNREIGAAVEPPGRARASCGPIVGARFPLERAREALELIDEPRRDRQGRARRATPGRSTADGPDVQRAGDRLPRRAARVARREPARRRARTATRTPTTPGGATGSAASPTAAGRRSHWPAEYGGRGATLTRVGDLLRGARPRRRAAAGQRARPAARRPDDHDLGHARAEGALPRADPHRRGDLVPGLLRARRRLRPRRAQDARGARTATSGSSPARRCGRSARSTRSGACSSRAPTPTRRSTRASPTS